MKVSSLVDYYKNTFPYTRVWNWITYGGTHREVAFTFKNKIFSRYQFYSKMANFKSDLVRKRPSKVHMGAFFSKPTKQSTPVSRELVFDIDISDYNDSRICCSEDNICPQCWGRMTAARHALDHIIRQEFGFSHILWVFSGRRGIHAWVCDDKAKALSDACRADIVAWINMDKKTTFRDQPHPYMTQMYEVCLPLFMEHILPHMMASTKSQRRLLECLGDEDAIRHLLARWEYLSMEERWKMLTDKQATTVVLHHTYPRIDSNVSLKMNHLLKIPFAVHPSTNQVCLPMPDTFDPEITTLEESLAYFDQFLSRLIKPKKDKYSW